MKKFRNYVTLIYGYEIIPYDKLELVEFCILLFHQRPYDKLVYKMNSSHKSLSHCAIDTRIM